jgi:histidinol-phosphate/aromatic aminotransferase/cobyric acid decarboxylase-like protein
LSSKRGFEKGQYIRLAVRNAEDNNSLINALNEMLNK